MEPSLIVFLVLSVVVVILVARTATVVPQQSAFVVEKLGRYSRTLPAGFHVLVPFVEQIAYRHSLKEQALDVAEQICITRDNVQVGVDAVLYMQVLDPAKASYGITNYNFAISQLAQTTLRVKLARSNWIGPLRHAAPSMRTWWRSLIRPPLPGRKGYAL